MVAVIKLSCLCIAVLTDRPPPIIRQGPSNQTLGVDSVALLKCQASGDPIPSISWLKDGVSLLGKDPRMSLQELGSLQIKSIKVLVSPGERMTDPCVSLCQSCAKKSSLSDHLLSAPLWLHAQAVTGLNVYLRCLYGYIHYTVVLVTMHDTRV